MRPMRARSCKRCSTGHQAGASLIELSVSLIFLSALVIGLTEASRAVQHYSALVASARNAARYVATHPGSLESISRARCLAVTGRALSQCTYTPPNAPVVPGMTVSHVSISLPVPIVDDSGATVIAATNGLSAIQAQTAMGASAGSVDLVTVTLGPETLPIYFSPLFPGLVPRFQMGPVSASMPVVAN